MISSPLDCLKANIISVRNSVELFAQAINAAADQVAKNKIVGFSFVVGYAEGCAGKHDITGQEAHALSLLFGDLSLLLQISFPVIGNRKMIEKP